MNMKTTNVLSKKGQDFKVRPAVSKDRKALMDLLNNAGPGCSAQTVWNIPWTWPQFQVVESPQGEVIASIGVEEIKEFPADEIRGLAVDKRFRGHGLASALVRLAVGHSKRLGRKTFCVTRGPDFFERVGFREIPPLLLGLYPWRRPTETNKGRVCMVSDR